MKGLLPSNPSEIYRKLGRGSTPGRVLAELNLPEPADASRSGKELCGPVHRPPGYIAGFGCFGAARHVCDLWICNNLKNEERVLKGGHYADSVAHQ